MAITGISLSDRTKTKKGNEYNSTNVGKYSGAAIGTGFAAYTGYEAHNAKKMVLDGDFVNFLKGLTYSVVDDLPEQMLPKSDVIDGYIENLPKYLKKTMNITCATIATLAICSAIGIGALVDGAINKVKAINADKANPMVKTEQNKNKTTKVEKNN